MSEPACPTDNLPDRRNGRDHCAYCGAPLDPGYYFCSACATPYKDVEHVLPPVRPELLTEGVLIAKKAPHVAPLFWTYFAVVLGTAVVCFLLFQGDEPAAALLVQSAALLVTTCVFAAMYWPSLAVQFKRIGFLRPAALAGLLALGPVLAINYYYHGWILRALGRERIPLAERLLESGLGEPALIVLICVLPAVIEEIAFRGLVQHWLHIAVRPATALMLASALFTLLHFSVVSAPYLFAVGMLLGWTKWKTGSLYPSMLIHFLHNFVVLEFFWR